MSKTSARTFLDEPGRPALVTGAEPGGTGQRLSIAATSELDRNQRIMRALGVRNGLIPRVDDLMVSAYYRYLSVSLQLPFLAHFPKPTNQQEEVGFRCVVLGLLDPRKHLGNAMDGIFCTARKGRYDVNLPLIDLYLPEESRDFQLIEDYWYWFWNWR